MTAGLYMVTDIAPAFTLAAHDVFAMTADTAVAIPQGFEGGSLDFAASPLAWLLYQGTVNLRYIGASAIVLLTCFMMWRNRVNILRNRQLMLEKNSTEIQSEE